MPLSRPASIRACEQAWSHLHLLPERQAAIMLAQHQDAENDDG
jgi:hypothetical protein